MSVRAIVDQAQESGRYTLQRSELEASGATSVAIQNAVRRLVAKGRLAVPRRGFYVVVPLEYRSAGSPPATWFVDDLMRFMERPYYVGLLSAAAIHGASHQAAQELQVVTSVPVRPITVGRVRLRFFVKRDLSTTPCSPVKTDTGSMRVSTPEATALDLVRYVRAAGGLSNVATVLAELAERIEPERFEEALSRETEVASVQRLGYLLDQAGQAELARLVAPRVTLQQPRWARLDPGSSSAGCARDETWRILVNQPVEVEA